MERIYNQNKSRFINLYGNVKFEKLYNKVNESNAIIKLTGFTATSGLPPTAIDFIISANTIPYVMSRFSVGASIMASLIELKIWNETVNRYRQLVSEQRLTIIAEQIAARWI
jgi:predicted MFS family arabinose efflux permease